MAENSLVNRVELNGEVVLDLSSDLVDETLVLKGVSFHDRTGAKKIGTLEPFGAEAYDGTVKITIL